MFGATGKMSVEASDVQTDEDCEELVEDGFSFSADILEKKTRRKRSSGKPPPSPRSPYLSSLSVNPRRAAVAAWRLPRASLGDARGETTGESGSARLTSLSNGHDLSQTLRSEFDVTPEILKQTLSMRKHKHLHSASNGFTLGTGDYREKEDMYDEIIRLKKSLQAQKSDNQQMKVKLRRLEEDNAKREKQIEELLDPSKGSDYTRSLVDKKKEGSVVLNGLKQRILKLEQQCREKENVLSKLQSELRTTNLEELKITVETYSEEIQRLRVLLEAAEKSSRAESKCSQRQQKALSSMVHRLSENLKQLQQENTTLREELNTDSPAGGIKGYREWSKQRLLRRLLEVEKRPEDSRRHAQSAKSSGRLDQEVQATPTEILRFTMATEAVVSVGTITEGGEEDSDLRERLSQLEKEKVELQEMLSSKDDELRQVRTEKEELEKETERWKAEQMNERDKERQQHKQELEQLWVRIRTLEDEKLKPAQAEPSSPSATPAGDHEDSPSRSGQKEGEQRDTGETEGERVEDLDREEEKKKSERRQHKEREKAARSIQTNWREHRDRDIVMLQSALRGHLLRESQLSDLLKDTQNKAVEATNRSDVASSVGGEMDVAALTMVQSAFRGHLARCSPVYLLQTRQSSVAQLSLEEPLQSILMIRMISSCLPHVLVTFQTAESLVVLHLRVPGTVTEKSERIFQLCKKGPYCNMYYRGVDVRGRYLRSGSLTHTHTHTRSRSCRKAPVLQGFLNTVFASRSDDIIQLKSRGAQRTEPTVIVGTAPTSARHGLGERQPRYRQVLFKKKKRYWIAGQRV